MSASAATHPDHITAHPTSPLAELSPKPPGYDDEKADMLLPHSIDPQDLPGSKDLPPMITDPDPNAIRMLRCKIDLNIMPLLCTLYLFVFLGRNNVGNAKIAGLPEDLKLTTTEYNMALSIFYIGYVILIVPSNICLKRFGPRIWLFSTLTVWCIIMATMSTVKNAAGLLTCRFFLGLAECALFPGAVLMLSLWYTKRELALRMGLFFGVTTISGAFGGVLAYAIGLMEGTLALRGWRWLFIIEALPVLSLVLVVVFVMPDFPQTAAFLTEEERTLAVQRLQVDSIGSAAVVQAGFSWPQFWMVFRDGQTYMYSISYMMTAALVYSMAAVVPSIVREFGLNPTLTQLLTAPAWAFAFVCTIAMALSSGRHQERGWHFAGPMFVSSLGYVLLIVTKDQSPVVRYICLTVALTGAFSGAPAFLAWFSANIGGQTKRGVATAVIISIGNCGGAVGGQIYRGNDAAHAFVRGHSFCAVIGVCGGLVALTLKYMLVQENKRRDRLTREEFEREAQGEDLCDNHPTF
ncbi:hypothetical protein BGZ74_004036, partial [Mortierella antarctica]